MQAAACLSPSPGSTQPATHVGSPCASRPYGWDLAKVGGNGARVKRPSRSISSLTQRGGSLSLGRPSRSTLALSRELPHLRLGLLQPESHVHLAVHRRRGGEMLLCLLALARAPVELAEAEVGVGDEGAHATLRGQGNCLPIVGPRSLLVESVLSDVGGE